MFLFFLLLFHFILIFPSFSHLLLHSLFFFWLSFLIFLCLVSCFLWFYFALSLWKRIHIWKLCVDGAVSPSGFTCCTFLLFLFFFLWWLLHAADLQLLPSVSIICPPTSSTPLTFIAPGPSHLSHPRLTPVSLLWNSNLCAVWSCRRHSAQITTNWLKESNIHVAQVDENLFQFYTKLVFCCL